MPAIEAFHAVRPLSPAVGALWPLVVLRAAVVVVSGVHQTSIDADNAYASERSTTSGRSSSAPPTFLRGDDGPDPPRSGCCAPGRADRRGVALIAGLDPATVVNLDLSAESDAVDGGAWLDPDCEDRLAAEALADGAAAVVTTFGHPQLTRSSTLSTYSPQRSPPVCSCGRGVS